MKYLLTIFIGTILVGFLYMASCSDDTTGASDTTGARVQLNVVKKGDLSVTAAAGTELDSVVVNSARVVIREVELEGENDDSLEFELQDPFVQDLNVLDTETVIYTLDAPYDIYDELQIEIGPLTSSDGQVFTDNPDLQDKSVFLEGYVVKGGTREDFGLYSDIELEQEHEINPPIVVDENTGTANIVLLADVSGWFTGSNQELLDPTDPEDRSLIIENIRKSFKVFEDENDDGHPDGENDDDSQVK